MVALAMTLSLSSPHLAGRQRLQGLEDQQRKLTAAGFPCIQNSIGRHRRSDMCVEQAIHSIWVERRARIYAHGISLSPFCPMTGAVKLLGFTPFL
jgi:hypothetical protein